MSFGYSSYTAAYNASSSFRCTTTPSHTPAAPVGSALGLAFSSIAQANANKAQAVSYAQQTGNWSGVSNGTYWHGTTKVIKGNGYVRYEPENGHCYGVGKNGYYSYLK